MAPRDHYEVLGVSREATDEELKNAFRRLAKRYHPDKNPGDKEAEERIKEIGEAYRVLSDPDARARYDRYGHEGLRGQGRADFSGVDFNDLFSRVFGDFGDLFGMGRSARQGNDIRYDVELTLEEAYTGKSVTIEVPKFQQCETCGGNGLRPGTEPEVCAQCGGRGRVVFQQGFFSVQQTCPRCGGKGEVIGYPCRECRGEGRTRQVRKVTVNIPKGVDDGMVLRMNGQGDAGVRGAPPGSLLIGVGVKPHALFRRRDDDLLLGWRVAMVEAAFGAEVTVPTLDGEARFVLPEGTETGETFTLRGKGMPHLHRHGHGDLKVRVFVETPTRLGPKEKELLREFGRLRGELDDEAGQEADSGGKGAPKRAKRGLLDKVTDFFAGGSGDDR
jgi:molecular chaperone DnaJ